MNLLFVEQKQHVAARRWWMINADSFCNGRMVSIEGCLRYLVIGVCLLLQACVTPTSKLTDLAARNGLERDRVRAGGFDMMIFDNTEKTRVPVAEGSNQRGVLRVYLEGDGSPWKYRTVIMPDPTPRNPLMLRLISYETSPAIYLGRPCYNGHADAPGCDNSLWTSGRYSDRIVESMASAIRALSKRHNATQLWLIGHSGGGTLAMLLAERLPLVTRIVTLAGNLDTDAWTKYHRYTPLYSSINPATTSDLNPEIWQWHLVGERDTVIPPQLIKPFILSQASASGFEFPGYDHGCCWEKVWPDVLQALALDAPGQVPGVQFKFRARGEKVQPRLPGWIDGGT